MTACTTEEGPNIFGKKGRVLLFFLGILPVAILAALTAVLYFSLSGRPASRLVFDPPLLLPILNTVFVFFTSAAVAYFSMKNYLMGTPLTVLFLGSGVLSVGMGSLAGGWLLHPLGPNATVTLHDSSVLLAAFFHVAAMVVDLKGKTPSQDSVTRGLNLAYSYMGVTLFIAFLAVAVNSGVAPSFFVDEDHTALRQWVLIVSFCLLLVTSVYFFDRFAVRKVRFLYWYAMALAASSVCVVGILLQPVVGSPLGWVARGAQYMASVYFFVGVMVAVREAYAQGLPTDHALAEAFRRSEQRIASILAGITDCHYELDQDWKFTHINTHALTHFGKKKEEFIGRPYREVFPHAEGSLFETEYGKALSAGTSVSFDAPSNTVPGRWVEVHAYPTDEGLSVFFRDVTDRKKSEEALRTSEKRFRSFFDLPLVGSAVVAPDGRWLAVNDRLCEIVGYSRDELGCLTWQDLTPPEELEVELSTDFQRLVSDEGQGRAIDKHYIRKDGSVIDVHVSSLAVRGPDGSLDYLVCLIQDVTEKNRAEEALKDKTERLALLSDVARELLASAELHEVVNRLCRRVMEYLDCDTFLNFLVDEEGRLRLNTCAGVPEETAAEISRLDSGVTVSGTVALEARRIVAENIPAASDPRTGLIASFGIKAYACHPLFSRGRVIGTLSFGTRSRPGFSDDDLAMMKAVAHHVAVAMERELTLQALAGARDELEQRVIERTAELSRARDKLLEQSRIMEGFFDSTITPLVFLDRDFNFVRVNRAYARCCERDPEGFKGRNHFELYPNEENEAIFRSVVETKIPYQATAKAFSFPDHPEWGVTYWDWTLTPLTDQSGEVEHLVFSLRDVTARLAAEQAVRRAGTYNRNLIEASLDPLVTIDPDGTIRDANSAAEKVTGLSRSDLVGTYFSDYFTEPERARAIYLKVFGEGAVRDYPLEIRHCDGRTTPVLYNLSAYYDDTGEITGIFAAARDISDLRRAEEQLRQAQKMEAIGTLAGGIAHDFNNVLASILGFTEMAIEEVPDRPQVAKSLRYVLKSALRARELVRQILAFSRKVEHERNPLPLTPLVKETIQFLRASIPTTVSISLEVTATSDTVLASPVEVQQILMNLVTNAALAMHERPGAIHVTLRDRSLAASSSLLDPDMSEGEYLELSVRDTGEGMTPEVTKRIFEPFFTTREVGKGSGMGLAVVYGIAKSLGGNVSVQSEPGRGSVFRVSLPKAQVEAITEPEDAPDPPRGRERILFVDDEPVLVELNRERLQSLGYEVTGSTSSEEALRLLVADPGQFDMVITDYTMPRLTGLELAGEILGLRRDIPIILCTGYSDSVSPEQAKAAGIREFLMKPLSKAEIAETVRRVLNESVDF